MREIVNGIFYVMRAGTQTVFSTCVGTILQTLIVCCTGTHTVTHRVAW